MMDINTEIRKLSSKDLFNLIQILELDESWRKLMATIPKTLFLDDYECKITIHNRHKYNSDHFKIIENAGSKYKKLCSEILLDEWGTSGRIRPRLGHLVSLLKKAELYRAADYVAINLLQLLEVERPSTGPAAKVPIPKDEDLPKLILNNYPSSLLNGDPLPSSVLNHLRTPSPNYPSSLIDGQISSSVLNQISPNRHIIPKIIVNNEDSIIENSEVSMISTENNSNVPAFSDLLKSQEEIVSKEVNICQDSSDTSNEVNSAFSVTNLLSNSNFNIPNLTFLKNDISSQNQLSNELTQTQNIPNLSTFNPENDCSQNIPAFSQIFMSDEISDTSGGDDLPNLTLLNQKLDSNNLPALSQILNSSENLGMPAFSQILTNPPADNPAFSQILDPKLQNQVSGTPKSGPRLERDENGGTSNDGPAFSQILTADLGHGPAFSQILESKPQIQGSSTPKLEPHLNGASSFDLGSSPSQIWRPGSQIQGSGGPIFENNDPLQNLSKDLGPHLSGLLKNDSKTDFNQAFSLEGPQIEIKIPELWVSTDNFGASETFTPAFSQILEGSSSLKIGITKSHSNVSSGSANRNYTVTKSVSSCELRDLGSLKGSKTSLKSENFGSNLTVQSSPFRTCVSPLPNLSLNTILPHFSYQELEKCTNTFDETVVSDQDSQNLNQAARVGRKLGSGAFGTVYLGIGLLEKPVAVKKLNLNGMNVVNVDDTITKQFRNEVELLCKYKHENLLSLLGYSCDGPTYCLIYEYICGGALKDSLEYSLKWPDKFRLLWTDRLYITLGTAKAVSYLHNAYSMPLIHRDIKSANILLDGFNKPKLCDFGLIKLTPNPNTNTSTSVFGTSAYMAPEAFRGDVSVKLDTFSFGVVLLELLTSLPPLDTNREGNDLVTHVEDRCKNDIKPLLDMNAGTWMVDNVNLGEELFDIAMECLQEKRHRPVMAVVVTKLSELIKKSLP